MMSVNTNKVSSEVNSLWIDTCYWTVHWDFMNVPVNNSETSELPTFSQGRIKDMLGDVDFYLKIQKTSKETFSVSLYRIFENPIEKGGDEVVLEVILALVGHMKTLETQFMSDSIDMVSVTYNIDQMLISDLCSWTVRCTMKLHEMTISHFEAHLQQELLKALGSVEKDKFSEISNDMAFLLEKQAVEDIRSGRQSKEFSVAKANLIRRTLKFAHEIAAKARAKNRGLPYEPNPPANVYLCYIRNGEERYIKEKEVFELYTMAHTFGLPYLVRECREFMKEHIEKEYILDMIRIAELTYDEEFLKELVQVFAKYYDEIMKFSRCQMLLDEGSHLKQIIIDSISRTLSDEGSPMNEIANKFISDMMEKELIKLEKRMGKKNTDMIAEKENSTKQESPIANISDQSPTAKFSAGEKSPKQKPTAEKSSSPEFTNRNGSTSCSEEISDLEENGSTQESSEEDDPKLESNGENDS